MVNNKNIKIGNRTWGWRNEAFMNIEETSGPDTVKKIKLKQYYFISLKQVGEWSRANKLKE